MVTQFFFFFCLFFTIRDCSPCHAFIIYVFGHFSYYLDISIKSIIVFISLIIILFFSLIFNEIIEINFWGLSYNTKRNITIRAESDENLNYFENESSDENDGTNENSTELNNSNDIYN